MANSSSKVKGDDITAQVHNDLRTDILSGHTHDGQEGVVPVWRPGSGDWTAGTTNNGGTVTVNSRGVLVSTGTTANGDARIVTPDGSNPGWSRGINKDVINWGNRVSLTIIFSTDDQTTNGQAWVLLGPASGDAIQDLDDKGIGIRIDNDALKGQAHNGTTLETVDLSFTLGSAVREVVCVSDGAGNAEWFVNGQSRGTSTKGPTSGATSGHAFVAVMADNGGDTADQDLTVHDVLVGVAQ